MKRPTRTAARPTSRSTISRRPPTTSPRRSATKPDQPDILLERAKSFAGDKKYNPAVDDLNKAIELKPDLVEAYWSAATSSPRCAATTTPSPILAAPSSSSPQDAKAYAMRAAVKLQATIRRRYRSPSRRRQAAGPGRRRRARPMPLLPMPTRPLMPMPRPTLRRARCATPPDAALHLTLPQAKPTPRPPLTRLLTPPARSERRDRCSSRSGGCDRPGRRTTQADAACDATPQPMPRATGAGPPTPPAIRATPSPRPARRTQRRRPRRKPPRPPAPPVDMPRSPTSIRRCHRPGRCRRLARPGRHLSGHGPDR